MHDDLPGVPHGSRRSDPRPDPRRDAHSPGPHRRVRPVGRALANAGRTLALALALLTGASVPTLAATPPAPGGLVVVINDALRLPSISMFEIRKLFLGRSRKFPDGSRAALASYGPESSFFNERALELSDSEVAAIWSRLQFSGRTPPPRVFDTAEEVVEFVASTPNALAYMPADAPRQGVRVIFNVPR